MNLKKNIFYGFSYLDPFFSIAYLINNKNNADVDIEEKRVITAGLLCCIGMIVGSALCLVPGIVFLVFAILTMVKYFKGEYDYKCILCYNLACKIVKDPADAAKADAPAEEAPSEDDKAE